MTVRFPVFFKHALIKNTAIYTFSKALNAAIPFFLLPILTRYLSTNDYGVVATIEVILPIILMFVSLNAHCAVPVKFFKLDRSQMAVFIGNAVFVAIIGTALVLTITLIFGRSLATILKIPFGLWYWLVLAMFSNFFLQLVLYLWRAQGKAFSFGILQTIHTVFNLGASVVLVVFFSLGWTGRVFGILISYYTAGMIAVFLLFKNNYLCCHLRAILP